jgi:hypothetical protein
VIRLSFPLEEDSRQYLNPEAYFFYASFLSTRLLLLKPVFPARCKPAITASGTSYLGRHQLSYPALSTSRLASVTSPPPEIKGENLPSSISSMYYYEN